MVDCGTRSNTSDCEDDDEAVSSECSLDVTSSSPTTHPNDDAALTNSAATILIAPQIEAS